MWKRFKRIYYTDYYYLRVKPSFDAVCFTPKRDIYFYGFGILAHYHGKDMIYNVAWAIDGDRSPDHQVKFADSEKDPKDKWFTLNLKE